MARLFDDASSQYLEVASALGAVQPLSMACWFNSDDTAANQTLISIGTNGGNARWQMTALGATGGDPVQALSTNSGGTANAAVTTSGFSANTWHHGCAVFASDTSRTAYIDGGNSATATTSITVSGTDTTRIGARGTTVGVYMSGMIAEAAIWSVALTADDVLSLSKAVSPLLVRPEGLIAYWPLIGKFSTEIDIVGGAGLTVSGATAAAHPRMFYPHSRGR